MPDRERQRGGGKPPRTQSQAPRRATTSSAGRQLSAQQAAVGNLELQRRLGAPSVQTKLKVSEPGDRHEREADRMADAVMRMPESAVQRQGAGQPYVGPELARQAVEEEEAQTKREFARQVEEEEEAIATKRELARQAVEEEEEAVQTKREIARQMEDEEETIQTKLELARLATEEEEEAVQTKAAGTPAMTPAVESGIGTSRGGGQPLDSATRGFFEPRFGRDFSGVKLHSDTRAARLAADLNAQAFTVGRDIYFARGKYQPGSETGRSLLAHELTHTIQQQPGAKLEGNRTTRQISRATSPRADRQSQESSNAGQGGAAATGEAEPDLTFQLPQVKARHLQVYQGWAASGNLYRNKSFARDTSPENTPNQRDAVWVPHVKNSYPTPFLRRMGLEESFTGTKTIKTPGGDLTGTRSELLEKLAIPQYGRSGRGTDFQVDHIVELQAAGWPSGAANTLQNMELLDQGANASAGAKTRGNISGVVKEYLGSQGQPDTAANAADYMAAYDVRFNRAQLGTGTYAGGQREERSQWWTLDEIVNAAHLTDVAPIGNLDEVGDATHFALLSPVTVDAAGGQVGGRSLLGMFQHDANQLDFAVTGHDRARVAGMRLNRFALQQGSTSAGDGAEIGTVQANWALPQQFQAPANLLTLPILKTPGNQYAGHLGTLPSPELSFPKLSPIRFDSMGVGSQGLTADGRLDPTIPLLNRLPIAVRLRGDSLEFAAEYSADAINLPVPGVEIDTATLVVFYNTTRGFGVEGGLELSVDRLGQGRLSARVTRSGDLEIEGGFDFDSDLFDQAAIDIWYRENAFGGSGTLAITDPAKIRGIRSARITATFGAGRFSAAGTVQPSIPGIEEAALTVAYSQDEGLAIGGRLNLASDIPGIESGSVDVNLRKESEEEGWKVAASGRAKPSIPGFDSEISISYDDGALLVQGTAAYERGMLAGALMVGATNRPIGDDGNPAGEPDQTMRAFGGGSLTLTLAPWLAATAAVRLTPNGEVEVTGRIGLPAALQVFPAKRFDKNIFSINLDIPIIGVAVAGQRIGVFATIGGGLDLSAGFGPGQLRDLHLEVTYNPDHEDQTLVQGGAEFFVPADAGLRLFIRGGLGAGIPIVSATAGLEIGGQLGIEGAVRAAVQVEWTPTKGIDLSAEAEIYAEPKFKFDITGFVKVEADLLLTTIDLYSKRWNLAAFEYGSGLRLGAKFPIHYQEGQPFDLSIDDIQFQVPDIDPRELLTNLIKQFA